MSPPSTLTAVIPTFERPRWIKRAVRSLARQARPPDEVIAVARDTDLPTHASIEELVHEALPFRLRMATVSEPGFMPPVAEGLRVAESDVILVMDDDAEALDDTTERILGHYARADVGAVGGRCINMLDDVRVDESVGFADRVGHVGLFGRLEGNMYRTPTFDGPVEVSFLMGGCMSFRRDVARRLEFDWTLNRVVATHYEIDLCLQVRNMGLVVLFDPRAGIRHYSAPRALSGNRKIDDATAVRWTSFNEMRILLRRLPLWRSAPFVARSLAVGFRRCPGILPWLAGPVARKAGFITSVALAATEGRLDAVASVTIARGLFGGRAEEAPPKARPD